MKMILRLWGKIFWFEQSSQESMNLYMMQRFDGRGIEEETGIVVVGTAALFQGPAMI